MGLKKQQQLACLSLLLLIILIFKTPTFAVGYGRFNKFRSGFYSSSEINHGKHQPGHKSLSSSSSTTNKAGNAEDQNGDDIFGADKRKIHTGPNPLHNR
ncbi:hypothetical protein BVRB_3g063170 [Beta vulgaris subsp. vulgaris]|nr:hypothetical protein BVRB_3g063170 [Beta vulgaris subsp. vulgaris]